jgi:tetratricopeptide (TPR) repeat protein
LRTGALSRAALFMQPETLVRVDQNTSISVSQTADETLVKFTQEDIVAASATAHTCGAGYFITRFPRKFKVNTPHLNAAVEGTEFLVAMRCERTELSVFEGKVLAAGAGVSVFPSQSVVGGQTLTVGGSEPPAIKLQLKPADAVQWTLYYPPITPAGVVPVEDCRVVAPDNRVSCLIARAEQLLRTGRVEEAQANIGDALAVAPASSDAKALSSIISLVRNDKAEALRLAREAVEATPTSAPAWLALSYAQQADFKLEAALTSATRAAELTPSSALALARVAELQLSLGWTGEAEKTAKQAVAANPSESRAQMILGFVHLAQIKVKEAREDFGRAIENDSSDPLSRLGLGLAIIRGGKLVEGREQIEIAVALDPTNSLIRSYVGKAYYEENTKERDKLASTQFGLAKELDSKDPTPAFYDALLMQVTNEPVNAVKELQAAIERNDNRAIYRSKLLIDSDEASRSVSLARLYQDLGFSQLAITEAAKSVSNDPGNVSAHRFLADTYSTLPRHEISRLSELLQSQIRQPVGLPLLQPLLAEDSLFVLPGAGPIFGGLNEFAPLFLSNGVGLQLYGLGGNYGTWGDQALVNITSNQVQFGFSQYRFTTEGIRPNNDLDKHIYDAIVLMQPAQGTILQAEVSTSQQNYGDLVKRFDPENFDTGRNNDKSSSARIGIAHDFSPQSQFILSLASRTDDGTLSFDDGTSLSVRTVGKKAEGQYVWRDTSISLVSGMSYYWANTHEDIFGTLEENSPTHTSVYSYAYANFFQGFSAQLGLTYDHLNARDSGNKEQINPKLGLIWTPTASTTLRAAIFRVLRRQFSTDQGLEPTQLAGFQQFFDDPDGTSSDSAGIALTQRIANNLYAGFEAFGRKITFPLTDIDLSVKFYEWRERYGTAYLYWLATERLALAFEPRYERFTRPVDATGVEAFTQVSTTQLPLTARNSISSGFSWFVRGSHYYQSGEFADIQGGFFTQNSSFWTMDGGIEFRLPRRLGILSIEGRNLFDRRAPFQDTDPLAPSFVARRFLLAKLALAF